MKVSMGYNKTIYGVDAWRRYVSLWFRIFSAFHIFRYNYTWSHSLYHVELCSVVISYLALFFHLYLYHPFATLVP
jgi:hypothetical protein